MESPEFVEILGLNTIPGRRRQLFGNARIQSNWCHSNLLFFREYIEKGALNIVTLRKLMTQKKKKSDFLYILK